MAIQEFRNLLLVDTPLGRGHVLFVEGADHHYYYTVILHETKALVTFGQEKIRVVRSYSHGWGQIDDKTMKDIIKGG
jgi:hypothetical protein